MERMPFGSRVGEEGVQFRFELLMRKLLKEKRVKIRRYQGLPILAFFPGREEGGLRNAERKPVYHRRPPILSRFSNAQSSAIRGQRFLKEQ